MGGPFPQPGSLFEGRYRIRSQVGSGGFARIYRATQVDLARDVALKILEPRPFEDLDRKHREMYDDQFVERFQREARNVAQLRDAHTITLYDFGRTTDGLFYMVFEYIDGETLAEMLSPGQSLGPDRTVEILKGVLASLHEAHALGILHRDIKPGNIMVYEHVGRRDQVKVLDFGISKALLGGTDLTLQDLTRQDAMVGTPHYISPEQLRGGDVGPASDLYSLGLVAHEMLTGERAVSTRGAVDAVNRQISPEPIVLPGDCEVPDNLRATVHRMLAKDPDDRFDSARAVESALEDWQSDQHREWTDDWLEPSGGGLERDEASDIEELPVGEVADQEYRTDADDDRLERPTRPFSGTDEEFPAGPTRRLDDRSSSRRLELLGVGIGAFSLPIVAFATYAWWTGAAPDPADPAAGVARRTSADAGPQSPGERETFVIETWPRGAHVKIEHRAVGRAPIELPRERFSFPATVQAELPDGRRLRRRVEDPGSRIVFRFVQIGAPPDIGVQPLSESEGPAAPRD